MSESREQKMAAARARLAELSAKFVDRTRGELATMRDALARHAAGDGAALGEIRHLAHRIAGTGATLGFEELSECAARVEKIADAQMVGALPADLALAQISGAVESLSARVEAAARR